MIKKDRLIYVELKTGYADDGPAWIGYCGASKSGSTIYFNGLALKSHKGNGVGANYWDVFSEDDYWVSGIKKDNQDRHWSGKGDILIDRHAVEDYLRHVGRTSLPDNIHPTDLAPSVAPQELHEAENLPLQGRS